MHFSQNNTDKEIKMRKKLLCLLAVIMISSLACFAACAKGQSGAEAWQVTKRIGIIGNDFEEQNNALENIVTEVTLTYNGKKVTEGYLFFDISKGSFAVSANVKVDATRINDYIDGVKEYLAGYASSGELEDLIKNPNNPAVYAKAQAFTDSSGGTF